MDDPGERASADYPFNSLCSTARALCYSSEIERIDVDSTSPLAFYKDFISQNKPVIIKDSFNHWPALKKWSNEYLCEKLGEKKVTVSVTPNGRADAVDDLGEFFVLPEDRQMSFSNFVEKLGDSEDEILYIQTQNGCMTSEFEELTSDIDLDFNFAGALGEDPDAINFWMGEGRSVSSLHQDPYENFYCVVAGSKTFELYPPTDAYYLPKLPYKQGRYCRTEDGWTIKPTSPPQVVNWINRDINTPPLEPIVITVKAGEALYLPALWFHQVSQSPDEEGRTIAVNFWYNMQYGIKWVMLDFMERCIENKRAEEKKNICT